MKHLSQRIIDESRNRTSFKDVISSIKDALIIASNSATMYWDELTGPVVDTVMRHTNNAKEIVDLVDQIYDKSIGNMVRDAKTERQKKEISDILNKIILDPDVQKWSKTPYKKSMALRQILVNKLSKKELIYMDDLIDRMIQLSSQIDPDYRYQPETNNYRKRH